MQPPVNQVRDPQTYAIIGAAIEVHKQLGYGFLEAAYHQSLVIEFGLRSIPFLREVALPVYYKGYVLDCAYRADFVAYGDILVEIKAVKQLTDVDRAQVFNYLKATGHSRALLFNFGAKSLEYERIVLNYTPKSASSA